MNRRTFAWALFAGITTAATRQVSRLSARGATPVPGASIQTIRWQLQQIAYSNEKVVTPGDPADYWLQLLPDGHAAIKAGCNQASGPYTIDGTSLTFGKLASTRATCAPGSISDEYLKDLGYVVSYTRVTGASDQLVLSMMADGGSLNFEPVVSGVVWQWTGFRSDDGTVAITRDPSKYTIEFLEDGSVRVLAGCNTGSGTANIDGSLIHLDIMTSLMACPEDSRAGDFLRCLVGAVSFAIRDSKLELELRAGDGVALFQPVIPERELATPTS